MHDGQIQLTSHHVGRRADREERFEAVILRSDGYGRSNLEASIPDLRHESRPDQSGALQDP
jgi:hypothetical protein